MCIRGATRRETKMPISCFPKKCKDTFDLILFCWEHFLKYLTYLRSWTWDRTMKIMPTRMTVTFLKTYVCNVGRSWPRFVRPAYWRRYALKNIITLYKSTSTKAFSPTRFLRSLTQIRTQLDFVSTRFLRTLTHTRILFTFAFSSQQLEFSETSLNITQLDFSSTWLRINQISQNPHSQP